MLRNVASRHVASCRVMSHYVTSCHVMSRHVTSCHVMSRHVTSCHVMTRDVPHVTSWHVMSRHVISRNVTSCHVTSCHVVSHLAPSCQVMSYHVTSYHVESRGTVTRPMLYCQLTSSTRNLFKLSMTVFVGCPEGCRYNTASAVYDLVSYNVSRWRKRRYRGVLSFKTEPVGCSMVYSAALAQGWSLVGDRRSGTDRM